MLKIILTILAFAYVAFPRDLLPDWFLGIGWIDDLLVLYLLWRYFFRGAVSKGSRRPHEYEQNSGRASRQNSFQKKTPYEVLEISPGASSSEIRQAYRTLANKYHPDKAAHLGPEFQALAEEKFKEIQQAYDELKTRGM